MSEADNGDASLRGVQCIVHVFKGTSRLIKVRPRHALREVVRVVLVEFKELIEGFLVYVAGGR